MATCEYCEEWCPESRYDDEAGFAVCWNCDYEDYTAEYVNYLKSEEWASVRRRKLTDAEFKCQRCGFNPGTSKQKLEVHHKTYERLGKELMEDLEVLCDRCHRKEHGR